MPSTSLPAADSAARLARMQRVADKLDSRFRLPVIGVRVGWDSILGIIPGVGDLVTTLPAAWMIYEGYNMGARKRVLAKMGANAGVDFVLGGIPILGDMFDVFFKSHKRNLALLENEMKRKVTQKLDKTEVSHG